MYAPGKQLRQTVTPGKRTRIHAPRSRILFHHFALYLLFYHPNATSNILHFGSCVSYGKLCFALLRLNQHNKLLTYVLINRDKGTRKLVRPHDY